ncbi:MAG: hypothetical protein PVSMB10_02130 [Pseudarthrobacter sp.]
MLATSAAVAGCLALSRLLEITVAPGITGISASGNPSTTFPTVADVPGEAVGLADAVTVEAGEDVPADDAATLGAAGLQAARANIAPVARAANPVGLKFFVTVTGSFLLGLVRAQPPV